MLLTKKVETEKNTFLLIIFINNNIVFHGYVFINIYEMV